VPLPSPAPKRDSRAEPAPEKPGDIARLNDRRETDMPVPAAEMQVAQKDQVAANAETVPLPSPAPERNSPTPPLPESEDNVARQDDSRDAAMSAPSDEVQVARQEPAVADSESVPLPMPAPDRDREDVARRNNERDASSPAAPNNEKTSGKSKRHKSAERADRRHDYDPRYRLRQVEMTGPYGNRRIIVVPPRYIRAGAPELGHRETLFTDVWREPLR
jgi:hypothetical protein